MSYGYYPVSFGWQKTKYYRTVEAADIQGDTQGLRALFLNTMHQHMINDFCLAAHKGNINGLTTHLALDLNVNHPGPEKCTALHYACKANQLAAAQFLVTKGADINLRNQKGKTPLELCDRAFAEQIRSAKKAVEDTASAASTATAVDSGSKPAAAADSKANADVTVGKADVKANADVVAGKDSTTTTLTPAFTAAVTAAVKPAVGANDTATAAAPVAALGAQIMTPALAAAPVPMPAPLSAPKPGGH